MLMTRCIGHRNARAFASATLLAFAAACGAGAPGRAVRVVVPAGATLAQAGDSLEKAGVIGSKKIFRLYASLRRDDRSIKPGTYLLRRNSSMGRVLDALREGKGLVEVVTVPEGFALSQIIPLVSSRLAVPAESVEAATRDTAWLRRLAVPTPTLEGYLFPDTYLFSEHTTARGAVETMAKRFEQVWKPEWTARLDSIELSRNEVLTLASIVEKEAKLPDERPIIAAVYMNRLRARMLLQADPTVQYAVGQHQSRVLYKHLAVRSPYNTYQHLGLPPGPIASPGRASIEAALYPANVPYRYFVALPDGHHEFRVDFASHEAARKSARKAWDSLATPARRDSSGVTSRNGIAVPKRTSPR
jgi:UPF0755 protein